MRGSTIGIIIAVLIVLGIVYYLVSPLFIVSELDEASPLGNGRVNDRMDAMSAEEKAEFDAEVAAMKNVVLEEDMEMPLEAMVIASGEFKPRAHSVSGNALLIEDNGKHILRFEGFETDNGPNLHIYLSSELGDSDFIDLGKIKATKGNVNYELPEDVDLERYDKVLVWCVPFKVLFSYSELK